MRPHPSAASVLALSAFLVLAAAPATAATPAKYPPKAGAGRPAAAPRTSPRMVLPFVQDDYGKAFALAQARKLPLFVESWAPW